MEPKGSVFEGKTLDDAVRKGLDALGLARAEVMITVIEEGSGGFLGLGARPYRVRVMPRPGGPPREADDRRRSERDRDRGGRGGRGRAERGERGGRRREGRPVRAEGRARPAEGRVREEARGRSEGRGRDEGRVREVEVRGREEGRGREREMEGRRRDEGRGRDEGRVRDEGRGRDQGREGEGRGPEMAERRREEGREGEGRGREMEGRRRDEGRGRDAGRRGEYRDREPSRPREGGGERLSAPPEASRAAATPMAMGEGGEDRGRRRRRRGRRGGRDERTDEVTMVREQEESMPDRERVAMDEAVVMADTGEPRRREIPERQVPERREERGHDRDRFRDQGPDLPAHELEELGRDATDRLLKAMGFEGQVTAKAEGSSVEVTAEVADGEDLLTGRKGEVRQALQHLLNRIINRGEGTRYHLQLEVNDFWHRREEELRGLARDLADEALRNQSEVLTEYLNAQERRIVHVTLREDPRVKTYAIGEGLIKKVAVAPADLPEGQRSPE
jgi:predicted RNA-binding protein Jag